MGMTDEDPHPRHERQLLSGWRADITFNSNLQ
jgi:hypothetical protein